VSESPSDWPDDIAAETHELTVPQDWKPGLSLVTNMDLSGVTIAFRPTHGLTPGATVHCKLPTGVAARYAGQGLELLLVEDEVAQGEPRRTTPGPPAAAKEEMDDHEVETEAEAAAEAAGLSSYYHPRRVAERRKAVESFSPPQEQLPVTAATLRQTSQVNGRVAREGFRQRHHRRARAWHDSGVYLARVVVSRGGRWRRPRRRASRLRQRRTKEPQVQGHLQSGAEPHLEQKAQGCQHSHLDRCGDRSLILASRPVRQAAEGCTFDSRSCQTTRASIKTTMR
jgi:hypothetical protein